jgi:glutamate--cysteine ligase
MSNPGDTDDTPITSIRQLGDFIAIGCKPKDAWRIGTEHEKFGFGHSDLRVPGYETEASGGGIRALLEGLLGFGGQPILDRGNPIGIKLENNASVSLEPAGQLELSGAPLASLHETRAEFDKHFAQVREVSEKLGLGFAPLGFHPFATRGEMPWMPKGRYAIMRRYMQLVGSRGLDMMTRTCTVQVNLDYGSEQEMVRKLRVSLALQPLATALFANSPFVEGRPTGLLSNRAHAWLDTDNARSGIPAVMFEDGFGFERYARWLVDEVPMYFVYRNGQYIDVAGQSFRDFMEGKLPGLPGEIATIGDFADHMTTVFTDVRVKRFIEMRGADAGTPEMMLAQSAFWVGLLYDDAALTAAERRIAGAGGPQADWADAVALREAVPRLGLDAPFRGAKLRELARDIVAIARDGLRARTVRDATGLDEAGYLDPLEAIADGGPTQAEHWLARYHGPWKGDVRPILTEAAI